MRAAVAALVVCALTLALAGAARAQDAEAARPLLADCLAAAEGRHEAARCIGTYARACAAEVEADASTLGLAGCAAAEAEAWERLIEETYAELVVLARRHAILAEEEGRAPPPLEALLVEAQRAWIAFRDADCEQEYAIWADGALREVAGALCRMERGGTRALELRAKRAQMALE